MRILKNWFFLPIAALIVACEPASVALLEPDPRVAAIHEQAVFADMHAHPSRFHRRNIEGIAADEIDLYRRSTMDLVVANISSDMAYDGGYENRDGTKIEKGRYRPVPGETYALSADRLARLQTTFDSGYAVHADSPMSVLEARKQGQVAIMPALEGADALEGDIGKVEEMYDNGLRLIQLIHFRNNELGHTQTWPYSPGGLTEFGHQVVREANRLGLIIDLAHANEETIADVLALSRHPVSFSHGGVRKYTDHDRAVTDEHANFHAIAVELLKRGYDDESVGKVMGGNFFRVWETVSQVR